MLPGAAGGGAQEGRGTRGRPARAFALCAAGTLLLYGLFMLIHPAFCTGKRFMLELLPWTEPFLLRSEGAGWPARLGFFLVDHAPLRGALFASFIMVAFTLSVAASRIARRGGASVGSVTAVAAVVAGVLNFGLPVLSTDIFLYVAIGEMDVVHSLDPYEAAPVDHPEVAALRYAPHVRHASIYGPLPTRLFGILYRPELGALGNLLLLRFLMTAALVGAFGLTASALRLGGCSGEEAASLLVLFAWNPVVLLETALDGHVDALAALLVALGLREIMRGRISRGLVCVTGLVAVKVSYAFLAPAIVAFAIAPGSDGRWRWGRAAGVLGAGALFYALWLLPDRLGWGHLAPVWEIRGWTRHTLAHLLRKCAQAAGAPKEPVNFVVSALFAALLLRGLGGIRDAGAFARRVGRDFLLYLLFFALFLYPWYVVAAFPAVLASGRRRFALALALFALCSALAVHGARMMSLTPGLGTLALRVAITVIPAALLLLRGGGEEVLLSPPRTRARAAAPPDGR